MEKNLAIDVALEELALDVAFERDIGKNSYRMSASKRTKFLQDVAIEKDIGKNSYGMSPS